jgi:DNA-binding Lrp family transcriptional regulator
MVTAFVLVSVKRGAVSRTAEVISELDGVFEVYSVAGEWDLVAVIRTKKNEQLADLVTNKMLRCEDVEKTNTLIAFQAFSKHDIERIFSLGLE